MTGAGGDDAARVPAALERLASAEVALLVSAFLTSVETTKLRCASQSCERLFVRNCPPATSEFVFFEWSSNEFCELSPKVSQCSLDSLAEVPKRNPASPLRVWRLDVRHCYFITHSRSVYALLFPRGFFRSRRAVSNLVSRNGLALKFADHSLKRDRTVVLTAVG